MSNLILHKKHIFGDIPRDKWFEVFETFDRDHNGRLSKDEFQSFMDSIEQKFVLQRKVQKAKESKKINLVHRSNGGKTVGRYLNKNERNTMKIGIYEIKPSKQARQRR